MCIHTWLHVTARLQIDGKFFTKKNILFLTSLTEEAGIVRLLQIHPPPYNYLYFYLSTALRDLSLQHQRKPLSHFQPTFWKPGKNKVEEDESKNKLSCPAITAS